MSDHEPRKRRKRKSQNKNDLARTDSESDKGVKETGKDGKKGKKQRHQQNVNSHGKNLDSNRDGQSTCIKVLFFMLVTLLGLGVGVVFLAFKVSDSPTGFTEDVVEKIQTLINDIKPEPDVAHIDAEPVVSNEQAWQDGRKVDISDVLNENVIDGDELHETYGIHIGRPASDHQNTIVEELSKSEQSPSDENDIQPNGAQEVLNNDGKVDSETDFITENIPSSQQTADIGQDQVKNDLHPSPAAVNENSNENLQFVTTSPRDKNSEPTITAEKPSGTVPGVEMPEETYSKVDITSDYDIPIRDELDKADEIVENLPDQALNIFKEILKIHPGSPRALYGYGRAADKLASIHRSNTFLEDSISKYLQVLDLTNVPSKLYMECASRAANQLIFRGWHHKAIKVQDELMRRFPSNVTMRNQMAVTYMMAGKNRKAEVLLREVLQLDPDNGFAKVHLGFILKTDHKDYATSSRLLDEGISTEAAGTVDGRFFYHLGDALFRLGHHHKAKQIYDKGAKLGVFLSPDQRSLYNVEGLTSQPWWDLNVSKYSKHIKELEKNWEVIRSEGMSLLNERQNGFTPESEDLRNTGDWRQYEIFARGMKNVANCKKAPKTCQIVEQITDASRCTRCQTKFSLMYPNTHVWPHTGPTNCRLRAHLGLVVPSGLRIRVANDTRTWLEGKVITFDDSFEHEVWHNGKSFRLVLIVDFWHPELTPHQKSTLSPI